MTVSRLSAAWGTAAAVSDVSMNYQVPANILVHGLQSMLRRSVNLTEPRREALQKLPLLRRSAPLGIWDLLSLARCDKVVLTLCPL